MGIMGTSALEKTTERMAGIAKFLILRQRRRNAHHI